MQTKIKNPYEHKPEEVSPASREIIDAMRKAFDLGVTAAQQAPIVIQKELKDIAKPFQRMKGCWCLGYRVEIEECEHIFKLRIMQGQKLAYQKDYVDVETLKIFGANFLSDLVTTELGHPVKFELC